MLEYNDTIMTRTLELAHAAEKCGEVPVGAVVYDPISQKIIGEAHNQPIQLSDPTAHAEILALRRAGDAIGNYRLLGLDMYVSLEPCTMCVAAISFARIRRIVFAATDEKGGGVVNGVRFPQAKTCHWRPEIVQAEIFQEKSSQILKNFFANRRGRV